MSPKTREGKIFKAFIDSLDVLTPIQGKFPPKVMREKTWRIVRKRVPDVTQAVVTRTLFKALKLIEFSQEVRKRQRKARRAKTKKTQA